MLFGMALTRIQVALVILVIACLRLQEDAFSQMPPPSVSNVHQQDLASWENEDRIEELITEVRRPGGTREASEALAKTGPRGAEAIVRAMRRGAPASEFLPVLSAMGPDASPAIPWLTEALRDPSTALSSAWTLQKVSSEAWERVPIELRAEGAKAAYQDFVDPGVQGGKSILMFVEAFAALAHPHLAVMLSHDSRSIREDAGTALTWVHDPSPRLVEAAAASLRSDVSTEVKNAVVLSIMVNEDLRAAALEDALIVSLLEFGQHQGRTGDIRGDLQRRGTVSIYHSALSRFPGSSLEKLIERCGAEGLRSCPAAIVHAAKSGGLEDRGVLVSLLGAEARLLRQAAAVRLAELARDDETTFAVLREQYLSDDPIVRDAAAWGIGHTSSPNAISLQQAVINDESLSATTRSPALKAIADAGALHATGESVERLVLEIANALSRVDEKEVLQLLATLKSVGARARSALPAVRELSVQAAEDDKRVRLYRWAKSTARTIGSDHE